MENVSCEDVDQFSKFIDASDLAKVNFSTDRSPRRKIYYHNLLGQLLTTWYNVTEVAQWAALSCTTTASYGQWRQRR